MAFSNTDLNYIYSWYIFWCENLWKCELVCFVWWSLQRFFYKWGKKCGLHMLKKLI